MEALKRFQGQAFWIGKERENMVINATHIRSFIQMFINYRTLKTSEAFIGNAIYFVLMSVANLRNLISVSEFRKCLTTLATDLLGYFIRHLIHP